MNMKPPTNHNRDMIFISHANPEDNVFTRWLALQLGRCGYPVWCDLTQLLGGEAFWTDIEKALRERTVKFIYVLSHTSNSKDGPLNELQVASNVARDTDDYHLSIDDAHALVTQAIAEYRKKHDSLPPFLWSQY